MDYFMIYFYFILEATKNGISDWRALKAPCNCIRAEFLDHSLGCPSVLKSAKHRTDAQHIFVECMTQKRKHLVKRKLQHTDIYIKHIGMAAHGDGMKYRDKSTNQSWALYRWLTEYTITWGSTKGKRKNYGEKEKAWDQLNDEYVLAISNWLLYRSMIKPSWRPTPAFRFLVLHILTNIYQ